MFLPEGSECTVLGRFGLEGKEVVCSHPEMIFQNEQQMARYIQQSVKNLNVFHIVLATGLAVCTGLLVK